LYYVHDGEKEEYISYGKPGLFGFIFFVHAVLLIVKSIT